MGDWSEPKGGVAGANGSLAALISFLWRRGQAEARRQRRKTDTEAASDAVTEGPQPPGNGPVAGAQPSRDASA